MAQQIQLIRPGQAEIAMTRFFLGGVLQVSMIMLLKIPGHHANV
ncbi:hypothetical protein [Schleiferilactobacillus perolens]|nr:hypothetical protein [Schleiferilactobacillus perolens]